MAFNAGSVQGKLELDAGDFLHALQRAKKSLDLLDKSNRKSVGGMQKFRNALGMVRDAVIVLPAAFRAITAPFRKFLGFLKESSAAAAEFQVTVRKFSTALQLAGNTGVARITERVKAYADSVQDLTGISNTAVLGVAQTLTVLGVQEDQLEESTLAVLNYAEAMDRDARMAALQFGRTLSGLIGELGEALPAVRDLTQAQLMQGEAFKVAGELFRGTAAAVAETTKGIRRSFTSAFGDLQRAVGDAMNPVLDAMTKGATGAVKAFTETIRANEDKVRGMFEGVARAVIGALRGILELGLDFPVILAEAKKFVTELLASVKTAGADMEVFALGLIERIQLAIVNTVASLEGLPGNLGRMATIIKADLVVGLEDTRTSMAIAAAEAKKGEAALIAQAKEAGKAADKAREIAAAIRDGSIQSGHMAAGYQKGKEILDSMESSLDNIAARQAQQPKDIAKTNGGMEKLLAHYREFNGISGEAKSHAELMNNVLEAAKANTEGLADAAGRAADGFRDAAGAAAGVGRAAGQAAGAAGGGGGGEDDGFLLGPGFGRSKGGSAGLDLTTIGGATAALSAARTAGRASVGGLYSNQARQSAFIVAQQIEERLQGLTDQAFADFTADLVDELNRMGVLDPTERSRFISERTAEAQRFGILPTERNVSASIGTTF